jgi:hypoxanthine phosphoribosyltransferase
MISSSAFFTLVTPCSRPLSGRFGSGVTPLGSPLRSVHDDIQKILLTEEQIITGIDRVAEEITRSFTGTQFTVVSVLKGSCVFASDLIRRIPIPLELAFVSASSYGDGTEGGDLALNFFPTDQEVRGRSLLLVDDILDTGQTMSSLTEAFRRRGAAEVRSCVFLDKPSRRAVDFNADFRCFEVENLFVVGYGLDYAGGYRNLPYVGALHPSVYQDSSETESVPEASPGA